SNDTGAVTLFSISTSGDFRVEQTLAAEPGGASIQSLERTALSSIQTVVELDSPDDPPQAPLVDDFNRPNATTLGENWTLLPEGYGGLQDLELDVNASAEILDNGATGSRLNSGSDGGS